VKAVQNIFAEFDSKGQKQKIKAKSPPFRG